MQRFVRELRRRHVFQVAAGYAAVAFVLLETADLLYPVLNLPSWAYRATVFTVIAAAPVVLILGWVYDLTSEGVKVTPPAPEPKGSVTTLPAPVFAPRSVAILPFANLTSDPENEYFSDGITEDIIARASRIADLKVISRTSVMQYKGTQKTVREIGRELGVAAILEGSVRRTGERVRIVAQLVDARTDAHKWVETYDRVLDDIFAIQADVANQIAAALQAELSPQEQERVANRPTENLQAYDIYLRARYEWNRRTADSLGRSARLLNQALKLDETFPLAWAGLADAYLTQGIYGTRPPRDVMPQARHAAEQALRKDAMLVEAITALACYHAVYDWDMASATRAFEAAISMEPQYVTAPQWLATTVLIPQGRFAEAEKMMARANQLDPLSPVINSSLAVLAYYRRDHLLAVEICEDVLGLHPQFTFAHYFRGLALVQLDRAHEAVDALKHSMQPGSWSTESMAALAHAQARAGQMTEARATIDQIEQEATRRFISPSQVAQSHVAMGDYDRAFALLAAGVEARCADLIWAGVRPTFDPIRTDARFTRLIKTIGVGVPAA